MPRAKRFAVGITPEDYFDYHIEREGPRVVGFAINYRALVRGAWREVARYDTDHGPLHVHRNWLPEDRRIKYLETRARSATRDYKAALAEAEADFQANWETYRRRLEESIP